MSCSVKPDGETAKWQTDEAERAGAKPSTSPQFAYGEQQNYGSTPNNIETNPVIAQLCACSRSGIVI